MHLCTYPDSYDVFWIYFCDDLFDLSSYVYPPLIRILFKKMGLFNNVSCPVAERIARRGFYIPSGLALTDEQIARVVQALKDIMS